MSTRGWTSGRSSTPTGSPVSRPGYEVAGVCFWTPRESGATPTVTRTMSQSARYRQVRALSIYRYIGINTESNLQGHSQTVRSPQKEGPVKKDLGPGTISLSLSLLASLSLFL